MLAGYGLTPTINVEFSNFLPIPILPVTMEGNAIPASYSRTTLLAYVMVFPQRNEKPGKIKPSPSSSISVNAKPKLRWRNLLLDREDFGSGIIAVSYTHLTLPTIYSV